MYFRYRHVKKIKKLLLFSLLPEYSLNNRQAEAARFGISTNVSCVLTKTQPICNIFFQRTQPSIFSYGPLLEKIFSQVMFEK